VWTRKVDVAFDGKKKTLGDILVPDADVPEEFFIATHSCRMAVPQRCEA
jgi:hypothetical protein